MLRRIWFGNKYVFLQLFEIIEVFRKTRYVEWSRNLVGGGNGYIETSAQTNFPRFLAFFLASRLKWEGAWGTRMSTGWWKPTWNRDKKRPNFNPTQCGGTIRSNPVTWAENANIEKLLLQLSLNCLNFVCPLVWWIVNNNVILNKQIIVAMLV